MRFSHAKDRGRSASAKPAGTSKKQCTFFAAGTCRFGDRCHDLHGGGGQRSASPKRKPKGRPKGKPAAAAVAVSASAGPAASILKVYVPTAVPGSVALAASTDYGPSDNCRSLLLDTGCKFDLSTRASVPPYLQDSIMRPSCPSPFRPPMTLSTVIWSLGNNSWSSMKSQSYTFSTQLVTSFLEGADALKMGTPFIGNPTPWHLP